VQLEIAAGKSQGDNGFKARRSRVERLSRASENQCDRFPFAIPGDQIIAVSAGQLLGHEPCGGEHEDGEEQDLSLYARLHVTPFLAAGPSHDSMMIRRPSVANDGLLPSVAAVELNRPDLAESGHGVMLSRRRARRPPRPRQRNTSESICPRQAPLQYPAPVNPRGHYRKSACGVAADRPVLDQSQACLDPRRWQARRRTDKDHSQRGRKWTF